MIRWVDVTCWHYSFMTNKGGIYCRLGYITLHHQTMICPGELDADSWNRFDQFVSFIQKIVNGSSLSRFLELCSLWSNNAMVHNSDLGIQYPLWFTHVVLKLYFIDLLSMGGSVAVHASLPELVPSQIGLIVVDVVEGKPHYVTINNSRSLKWSILYHESVYIISNKILRKTGQQSLWKFLFICEGHNMIVVSK